MSDIPDKSDNAEQNEGNVLSVQTRNDKESAELLTMSSPVSKNDDKNSAVSGSEGPTFQVLQEKELGPHEVPPTSGLEEVKKLSVEEKPSQKIRKKKILVPEPCPECTKKESLFPRTQDGRKDFFQAMHSRIMEASRTGLRSAEMVGDVGPSTYYHLLGTYADFYNTSESSSKDNRVEKVSTPSRDVDKEIRHYDSRVLQDSKICKREKLSVRGGAEECEQQGIQQKDFQQAQETMEALARFEKANKLNRPKGMPRTDNMRSGYKPVKDDVKKTRSEEDALCAKDLNNALKGTEKGHDKPEPQEILEERKRDIIQQEDAQRAQDTMETLTRFKHSKKLNRAEDSPSTGGLKITCAESKTVKDTRLRTDVLKSALKENESNYSKRNTHANLKERKQTIQQKNVPQVEALIRKENSKKCNQPEGSPQTKKLNSPCKASKKKNEIRENADDFKNTIQEIVKYKKELNPQAILEECKKEIIKMGDLLHVENIGETLIRIETLKEPDQLDYSPLNKLNSTCEAKENQVKETLLREYGLYAEDFNNTLKETKKDQKQNSQASSEECKLEIVQQKDDKQAQGTMQSLMRLITAEKLNKPKVLLPTEELRDTPKANRKKVKKPRRKENVLPPEDLKNALREFEKDFIKKNPQKLIQVEDLKSALEAMGKMDINKKGISEMKEKVLHLEDLKKALRLVEGINEKNPREGAMNADDMKCALKVIENDINSTVKRNPQEDVLPFADLRNSIRVIECDIKRAKNTIECNFPGPFNVSVSSSCALMLEIVRQFTHQLRVLVSKEVGLVSKLELFKAFQTGMRLSKRRGEFPSLDTHEGRIFTFTGRSRNAAKLYDILQERKKSIEAKSADKTADPSLKLQKKTRKRLNARQARELDAKTTLNTDPIRGELFPGEKLVGSPDLGNVREVQRVLDASRSIDEECVRTPEIGPDREGEIRKPPGTTDDGTNKCEDAPPSRRNRCRECGLLKKESVISPNADRRRRRGSERSKRPSGQSRRSYCECKPPPERTSPETAPTCERIPTMSESIIDRLSSDCCFNDYLDVLSDVQKLANASPTNPDQSKPTKTDHSRREIDAEDRDELLQRDQVVGEFMEAVQEFICYTRWRTDESHAIIEHLDGVFDKSFFKYQRSLPIYTKDKRTIDEQLFFKCLTDLVRLNKKRKEFIERCDVATKKNGKLVANTLAACVMYFEVLESSGKVDFDLKHLMVGLAQMQQNGAIVSAEISNIISEFQDFAKLIKLLKIKYNIQESSDP